MQASLAVLDDSDSRLRCPVTGSVVSIRVAGMEPATQVIYKSII
jgi:hypothetical protein